MPHPDDPGPDAFDATPFRLEWTSDGHATEETVHAWLDGALEADDQRALESHVTHCPACAASVAEARGYIAASARIMLAADVSSRPVVRRSLAAESPAESPVEPRVEHATPRWFGRRVTRVAAAALVMVGGAVYLTSGVEDRAALPADAGTTLATPAPRVDSVRAPSASTREAEGPAVVATGSASAPRVQPTAPPPEQALAQSTAQPTAQPTAEAAPELSAQTATQSLVADVATPVSRTIAGRVMDRGVPVASASVLVVGTTVGTLTDSLGRYTLQRVPATATTIQARRIGYNAASVALADVLSDSSLADFQLSAVSHSLNSVVVTSPFSVTDLQRARCFIAEWDAVPGHRPLLTLLRGTFRDVGTNALVIEGWPAVGQQTTATFVLDRAGRLTGSAVQGRARLAFDLQSVDGRLLGTVTETRGALIREEDVEFVPDTSVQRCSRNE